MNIRYRLNNTEFFFERTDVKRVWLNFNSIPGRLKLRRLRLDLVDAVRSVHTRLSLVGYC